MRFRKVSVYDNEAQIMRLLYHANLAHQTWSQDVFQTFQPWLHAKGFLYHYKNLFIASEEQDRYPLAIVCGLGSDTPLFDHAIVENIPLDCYVKSLRALREYMPSDEYLITGFCVDPGLKDDSIGYDLLTSYIHLIHKSGYNGFRVDCSTEDHRTIQRYEKLGFHQIGESLGFSTDHGADARLANLTLRLF